MKRIFFSVLILSLLSLSAPAHAGQTTLVDGKASLPLPAADQFRFLFQHTNGDVYIMGQDADEIRVETEMIDDERFPGHLSIDENKKVVHLSLGVGNGNNDVRIWLPRNCGIDVQAIFSDISISDTLGDIELKLVNGEIQITNAAGAILIESVNGKTTVMPSAVESDKPVSIMCQNGDIHLELPGQFSGSANVKTIKGKVISNLPGTESSPNQDRNSFIMNLIPMVNRTIPINNGTRPITLNTVNGDIHIRIQ